MMRFIVHRKVYSGTSEVKQFLLDPRSRNALFTQTEFQ